MKSLLTVLRRIILWDYERATWQYDLLVALIVGAVLLVPGSFFGDRDRPMKHSARAQQAAQIDARANDDGGVASKAAIHEAGNAPVEITVESLNSFLQKQGSSDELKNNERAALVRYLRNHLNRDGTLDRYEVRLDDQGQPSSYRVWIK
ncbi:MAG TPA: hypothetical protein VFD58_06950 [Blastocatellia bacterium]|nr:hypothetical protein [Blastocatellia bacterium]